MYLSDMVVDRGKDERRESLITEQLASGLLKVHPDANAVDNESKRTVSNEFKLDIVMKMSERTGSIRKFAKSIGVWPSAIYNYRLEYLNGDLGTVDDDVVERLKG